MIRFEDFAPRLLKSVFFSREFESFEAALAGANEWIDSSGAMFSILRLSFCPRYGEKMELPMSISG